MRHLALQPLWAVVVSVGVAACSSTSVPKTSGPSPTSGSSPTIAAPPSTATSASTDALGSIVSLPSVGRILFTTEPSTGNRIFFTDPNGMHEIPTDVPDTTLAHGVWAPSDAMIFDSERFGPRHLFRVGTDGNGLVQLTSGDASQDSAAVSLDGSMIVYGESNPTQDLGLHIANADGTHVRALTKAAGVGARGGDDEPSFSPDGAWVVFVRAVDPDAGKAALWVIRTDGTGLRRLTDDATDAGHARWSPDGKRILFTGHNDATTFAPGPLWVVDVSGGKPAPLTDPKNPGWSFEGDWSPDGRQIVFDYFLPASLQPELRVIDADGTHSSTLWVGGAETPDWGP